MARPDPEKLNAALRANLRRRKASPAPMPAPQAPESPESAPETASPKPSGGQG
jgi:hypothetical protein